MKRSSALSEEEVREWGLRFRSLSNSARYDEAYALAKKLMKRYPGVPLFAYYEAVMTAEDDLNYSPAELDRRFRSAAAKLRKLLLRARAMSPSLLDRARNEYYWFSRQPRKQHDLGVERVKGGDKYAYYSQGVGAAQLAKKYALGGRRALCLRWAKKSERAWLRYFRVMPNWYNSYLFYAATLGYQGKVREMDRALARAAKIAGKPSGWSTVRKQRAQILAVREKLEE